MRTRKLQPPPPLCAWCDDPCSGDTLCAWCRAVHDSPVFYCPINPAHIPTCGSSCATCDFAAAERARIERENAPYIAQLRAIRAQHIAKWHERWPGCEFGKAHFGMMIDRALASVGASPDARA